MPRRMRVKKQMGAQVAARARSRACGLHFLQAFQVDDPDVFALCVDQTTLLKS
jgi:hypothetical protein